MADAQLSLQQWLPGLEPVAVGASRGTLPRRQWRGSRATPRPPSIDKLIEPASAKVRRFFNALRADLLQEKGIAEGVHYDERATSFVPAYSYGQRELVRIHLDPVLAATVTLDPGEKMLAALLEAPGVAEPLRNRLLQSARRSGRRVFLALLVRNADELGALVGLLRARVALER